MASILSNISILFIPIMIIIIMLYAIYKRAPIYDYFIEGTKDGIKTAVDILPFIIAIFVGIESLVSSGAMEFLEGLLAPLFNFAGIPEELISLILLRPVSGSGSLVLVEKIVNQYGADSFVGRAASVMTGSCETVFYVLAVYFGATSVTKVRHALIVGLIGYIVGVFASVIVCVYI